MKLPHPSHFSDILLPSILAVGLSGVDNPSAKMWYLSLSHFTKHDEAMTDRWKGDMDGILIYVRFKAVHRYLETHLPFAPRFSDGCILRDSCCISHRKLQVPQA